MPHDLLQAGADVVAVGTESFRDPLAGARVAAELAESQQTAGSRPSRRRSSAEPIAHNA